MKTDSPYAWRKGTVFNFRRALHHQIVIRDRAQQIIDELLAINKALMSVKLRRANGDQSEPQPVKKKAAKSGKPHWTQTPEGRKRMSEISGRRYKKAGKKL